MRRMVRHFRRALQAGRALPWPVASRSLLHNTGVHFTPRADMATKSLTATRRQKRALKIPTPTRRGNIKVPAEGWVNAAKVALIEEGIGAVKIDRLAQRLKVSRG